MKNLFFALITATALTSNAQILHYCDATVQEKASEAFKASFPNDAILLVDSSAINYVGRHTKRYVSKVVSETNAALYEIQVFEFETEVTECVVDFVKKVN